MARLTTIDFHGAKLIAIAGDCPETTLVAMPPVVEGMGLQWEAQRKKIMSHPVLSKGTVVTEVPSNGGPQKVTCLSLDLLNFWLATIHPDRIKDETVRARVIEYQTECARVLFNHFFGPMLRADDMTMRDMDAADLNARVGASRHAMRQWGKAAGAWAWKASGLPLPPKHLLTPSQQAVLDLVDNRVLEVV